MFVRPEKVYVGVRLPPKYAWAVLGFDHSAEAC